MIRAEFEPTFEGWRKIAREYLQNSIPPSSIQWNSDCYSLFALQDSSAQDHAQLKPSLSIQLDTALKYPSALSASPLSCKSNPIILENERPPSSIKTPGLRVPAEFIELAETLSFARDENRWDLLYRLLYRLQHETPQLLKINVDPDVRQAQLLQKSIQRDIHKMHAFVRFKKCQVEGEEVYKAWYKPEHYILKPAAPFFVRRFGDRRWSIFTPDGSAHWDLQALQFGPGIEQNEFHSRDDWDEVWRTYYKSIFNPARIKVKAMKAEMAPRFWSALPEAQLIPELIREAPHRLQIMAQNQNRAAEVKDHQTLQELRNAIGQCKACPLYSQATQAVFGEGPENAEIMIVGEQPGDQEDQAGQPFVGPAGDVLENALKELGYHREQIYLTNAVKHFKWVRQGKMRLHQKASGQEMHACRPWLEAEIAKVKPKVIVALGVTAATALLGRLPKIATERGKVFRDSSKAPALVISWHPAAILRAPNSQESDLRMQQLKEDLHTAFQTLASEQPKASSFSPTPSDVIKPYV